MKVEDMASSSYKIYMKLYFNQLNEDGSTPADFEKGIICQKQGHLFKREILFEKISEIPFEYSNEYCASLNKLKIIEVSYEVTITLEPNEYANQEGYYIAHNRCCRNANINNITNSVSSGLAFYT